MVLPYNSRASSPNKTILRVDIYCYITVNCCLYRRTHTKANMAGLMSRSSMYTPFGSSCQQLCLYHTPLP
jgi:hypothetical protein